MVMSSSHWSRAETEQNDSLILLYLLQNPSVPTVSPSVSLSLSLLLCPPCHSSPCVSRSILPLLLSPLSLPLSLFPPVPTSVPPSAPPSLYPSLCPPVLTGMVPAAPSSASSPPAALEHEGGPEFSGVLAESVWTQITDLQPGELTQELLERHPETDRQTERRLLFLDLSSQRPVFVQTYQNSPSSILHSISSFSAGLMESHSDELKDRNQSFTCLNLMGPDCSCWLLGCWWVDAMWLL